MTCTLCDGLGFFVVFVPGHPQLKKDCPCRLQSRFASFTERWISDSVPAKKNYYEGLSETNTILVTSEEYQARMLHTAFRNFFDKGYGPHIPKFIDEDTLLKLPFEKDENGGQVDNPYLNKPRILLRLCLNYKPNSDFQNKVLCDFIKYRKDKGLVTWLIREKPLTKSSFDYSERLESLIQKSFTPIILK